MTKDEVVNLSELARIALSDEEIERLPKEITAILEYVSTVKEIVGTDKVVPQPGPRYNIMRPDKVIHEPGSFTETLLDSAPRRQGDYLVVNKILQQDE